MYATRIRTCTRREEFHLVVSYALESTERQKVKSISRAALDWIRHMPSYSGRYADYYDTFYSVKDYASESAFVHRMLTDLGRKPPGRLLELACGTGSHALQLERLGWDVVATDQSEDMLRVARAKAKKNSSRVEFRREDMRALPTSLGEFDAAIALFDSIGHVHHDAAVAGVLASVRAFLKPGGSFLFEFLHSVAMLNRFEPVRVRRWTTQEGELIRISETSLDPATRLATIRYEVVELRSNGRFERVLDTQINRFFAVAEIQTLLAAAGLAAQHFFAGFTGSEQIDSNVWRVVAVAKRP
jgi:SAM-dependent methyltransferase